MRLLGLLLWIIGLHTARTQPRGSFEITPLEQPLPTSNLQSDQLVNRVLDLSGRQNLLALTIEQIFNGTDQGRDIPQLKKIQPLLELSQTFNSDITRLKSEVNTIIAVQSPINRRLRNRLSTQLAMITDVQASLNNLTTQYRTFDRLRQYDVNRLQRAINRLTQDVAPALNFQPPPDYTPRLANLSQQILDLRMALKNSQNITEEKRNATRDKIRELDLALGQIQRRINTFAGKLATITDHLDRQREEINRNSLTLEELSAQFTLFQTNALEQNTALRNEISNLTRQLRNKLSNVSYDSTRLNNATLSQILDLTHRISVLERAQPSLALSTDLQSVKDSLDKAIEAIDANAASIATGNDTVDAQLTSQLKTLDDILAKSQQHNDTLLDIDIKVNAIENRLERMMGAYNNYLDGHTIQIGDNEGAVSNLVLRVDDNVANISEISLSMNSNNQVTTALRTDLTDLESRFSNAVSMIAEQSTKWQRGNLALINGVSSNITRIDTEIQWLSGNYTITHAALTPLSNKVAILTTNLSQISREVLEVSKAYSDVILDAKSQKQTMFQLMSNSTRVEFQMSLLVQDLTTLQQNCELNTSTLADDIAILSHYNEEAHLTLSRDLDQLRQLISEHGLKLINSSSISNQSLSILHYNIDQLMKNQTHYSATIGQSLVQTLSNRQRIKLLKRDITALQQNNAKMLKQQEMHNEWHIKNFTSLNSAVTNATDIIKVFTALNISHMPQAIARLSTRLTDAANSVSRLKAHYDAELTVLGSDIARGLNQARKNHTYILEEMTWMQMQIEYATMDAVNLSMAIAAGESYDHATKSFDDRIAHLEYRRVPAAESEINALKNKNAALEQQLTIAQQIIADLSVFRTSTTEVISRTKESQDSLQLQVQYLTRQLGKALSDIANNEARSDYARSKWQTISSDEQWLDLGQNLLMVTLAISLSSFIIYTVRSLRKARRQHLALLTKHLDRSLSS